MGRIADTEQIFPCNLNTLQHILSDKRLMRQFVNPYNRTLKYFKSMKPKCFFQFEIIINVLFGSFCCI